MKLTVYLSILSLTTVVKKATPVSFEVCLLCDLVTPRISSHLVYRYVYFLCLLCVVKWFESFYNYNTRQGKENLYEANGYAGENNLPQQVRFHANLAGLGKTNVLDSKEKEMLGWSGDQPPLMKHPVFLYEVSQPFDGSNQTRLEQYCQDVSDFIGISPALEPIVPREKPGVNYHYAIDICDDVYADLRADLLEMGGIAAEWIKTYFIPLPDVKVSSPEHFIEMLNTWTTDPCDQD
jgi:hypothetical protein